MATLQRKVAEWPAGRYRLTEKASIGRVPGAEAELLNAGDEVVWNFLPGPHMEPIDAQARANVEHAAKTIGAQSLDPTDELSMIVGEVDDVDAAIIKQQALLVALQAKKREAQVSGHSQTVAPPAALTPAAVRAQEPAPQPMVIPGMPPPLIMAPPPPA